MKFKNLSRLYYMIEDMGMSEYALENLCLLEEHIEMPSEKENMEAILGNLPLDQVIKLYRFCKWVSNLKYLAEDPSGLMGNDKILDATAKRLQDAISDYLVENHLEGGILQEAT
jgi:hypothetical protein